MIKVIVCLLLVGYFVQSQQIPSGFNLIHSAKGVKMYKKDYAGGQPDYIQVVDLSAGARIKLLHGKITNSGTGQGVYKGDNPEFLREWLKYFWNKLTSDSKAFSIINGQFFSTNDDPTKLAFPVKINGKVVSDGYGIGEYKYQKLMLEIWASHVCISNLSERNLYNSSAPNIIIGLTEDADKGYSNYTGRTFIGIMDQDSDGYCEIVLIFNSKYSRQYDAGSILRCFGAKKIVMFDGGGSTQLICKGISYINSSRKIPQTIGILSCK